MERLTHEADFGLEDWEETLFFVESDPNGAYNIIDIAKWQGEPEFDEILKNISLRLAAIEDILGDEYDLDRLREMVQAKREGKIPKYTIGDTVYDRFGNAWEVTAVELHSMRTKNEWLYRCGHKGTDDYRALWHFEAFPSKEDALRREQE